MQQGGEGAYALPPACQAAGKQTETRSAQRRDCLSENKIVNAQPNFKGETCEFFTKEAGCSYLACAGSGTRARLATSGRRSVPVRFFCVPHEAHPCCSPKCVWSPTSPKTPDRHVPSAWETAPIRGLTKRQGGGLLLRRWMDTIVQRKTGGWLLRTAVGICSRLCACRGRQAICCRLTNCLLTTGLTADSTKLDAMGSPCR